MNNTNYYKIKIHEKWNEIKQIYTSNPDNKLISKIFEWYTCIKLSEEYNKIFYEYSDIEPDFREQNQMSQTDTGIDCCDLDSTIVQCKLRSGNLCWGELGTFFGSQVVWNDESKQKIIRWKNLIIARNSNSKLSYNLTNKSDLFEDKTFCLEEFVRFCDDLLANPPIYPKINKAIPKLRDYQVECIDQIKNTDKNLIISLPTGTGKNFIIINYLEPKKKYLILVPRIILMEQIQQDIISLRPEFESQIQTIGNGDNQFKSKKSITICVFNSISSIDNFDKFDKIFVDEAHHIAKPQIYMDDDEIDYENNKSDLDEDLDSDSDSDNNSINSDEDFNENTTHESDLSDSTDKTEDEVNDNSTYIDIIRELTKFNNNVYMSATIDKIEGFDYYSKDIREMINHGYLSDYTINIPIFSEDPTNINICWHLIKNYSHIIIYCNSQKEGIEINNLLNKLVKGCSEYIDCKTTKSVRDKTLRKFKRGKLTFLVNVKILVEGFDAPITQGVCFLHMPKSKTTLVQIIGRALRLHPNKKIANIILPCSTSDDTDNITHFLKVMAQNDSRIRKSYQNKNLSGYINLNKIKYDDDVNYEKDKMGANIKLDEIVEARFEMIYDRMGNIKNNEEIWMHKLEEVKAYIDKYGKRPSMKNKDKKIRGLGRWTCNQIINYKNNHQIMKNVNIRKIWCKFINDIKYKEYFYEREQKWINNLNEVINFIDLNNTRPTIYNHDIKIKSLAYWLNTQLINYKNDKIILNIEITQTWKKFINQYKKYFDSNEEKWISTLNDLKKYLDTNKSRPSASSNDEYVCYLGRWINTQQNNYNKNKNIIKNINIKNLWEEFNCEYKLYFIDYNTIWLKNLNDVKKYIDINLSRPSPHDANLIYLSTHNINSKYLGEWISTQQKNYSKIKGEMKNEETKKLWEDFICDDKYKKYFIDNKTIWIQNFNKLKNFIDKNNIKPSRKSDNKDTIILANWINAQKNNYLNKIKIMKDEEIYKIWKEFIENQKYSKYFN